MLFTSDARAWHGEGCGIALGGFLEEQDSLSFISQPLVPGLTPRHSIQGRLWIWAILGDPGDKGLMLVLGPAEPKSASGWETPRGYQLSCTPGHCTAQRKWCTDPGRRGFGGEGGGSTHPQCRQGLRQVGEDSLWKPSPRPSTQDTAKPSALRDRPCGHHCLSFRVLGLRGKARTPPLSGLCTFLPHFYLLSLGLPQLWCEAGSGP